MQKASDAQKTPEAQKQQGNGKEKASGVANQSGGKRKPEKDSKQAADSKDKNKRRRQDKPALNGIRFRLLCFEVQAGAVIGRGGDTVRSLRKSTGAEVAVLPAVPGQHSRVVVIDSLAGNRAASTFPAKEALLACATLTVEGDQPLHAPDPSKLVEVRLLVNSSLTTGLLGLKHLPGCLTAGDIAARCGASVIIPLESERPQLADQSEEYLVLRGPWPAVFSALNMIADEVRHQFFDIRDRASGKPPPLGQPAHGAPPPLGFGAPPSMGMVPGPFDPLEAMQLGIGLGMEMAVVAAAGHHIGVPEPAPGPAPGGGPGSGTAARQPPDGGLSVAGLVPEFRSTADASMPVSVTYKLVVPENKAGRFIGKGGENLREVRQALGLNLLKVHPAVKDTGVRVLEVSSTEPAASSRCAAVEALLLYVDRLAQSSNGGKAKFTLKMVLANQYCGAVVGPRAAIIRQISARTSTSCVVHKKGDMPPYGAPDEQELEAEGEPRNVMEAIRMVAAICRGCELRRQGIVVRETIGTPEFDVVRARAIGGGPQPQGTLGPMVSAANSGMEPEGSWGPPDVHGGPMGGPQGPAMPPPQHQQQHQQQQVPPQHLQHQQQQQTMSHPSPHIQQHQQREPPQQQRPPRQPRVDEAAPASKGPIVAGLPPLGPNDVRLTIFVAAALVNAPEGVNGTNVQQVQGVTGTVVTLRQPVASGDYELDITGTMAQVMQAHALLTNIMTIGAILQQKPQLAPQQAPPAAAAANAATAAAAASAPPVTTTSGTVHQVVVQPNQGVVISSQAPPQQQQPSVTQQSQQQQQPQEQQPSAQAQQPAAQLQGPRSYAEAVQQQQAPPAQQATQQQQAPRQQAPPQQQEQLPQQQQMPQRQAAQPSQGGDQQQGQQQRAQDYLTYDAQASGSVQPSAQKPPQQAAAAAYSPPAVVQQHSQQQQQQLYAPQSQSQAQTGQQQTPYGQPYTQPPAQQQHPYYSQQQQQQPVAAQQVQTTNPYAAYGSHGYGAAGAGQNAPQATAATTAAPQAGAPATVYGTSYGQSAAVPASGATTTAPATASAPAPGSYAQQQPHPGYGYPAAGTQGQPFYQQQQQPPQQQPQQQTGQSAHEQYYMHMQQQYAAYHAAAAAAATGTASAPYTSGAYGYGYGAAPAPAPQ